MNLCWFLASKSVGASTSGGSSTATTASTTADPKTNDTILPTDKFTEADVGEITKLGFPRDKVFYELRTANGDKTQAMAALFAKSLKF